MKNKGLLFGGALMAAGLAAQSAEADFSFTYSVVDASAYTYGGFGPYFDDFSGPGTWSVLAEDLSAAAASMSTPVSIMLNADTSAGATAYAFIPVSLFTVTYSATADVSWSFDAGYGYGFVYLFNITDGLIMLFEAVGTGATAVSLEVGKEYRAAALAFSFEPAGKSFVEIVIPLMEDCPWDLDGDDTVGTSDLIGLLGAWGKNPGGPPDFNGDGVVNATDLIELLGNWGPCPK